MNNFIKDIKENYLKMERELVTQLNYKVTDHALTAGTYREEIWADFFRRIVPKKFNIARSVFIIDSKGNVSKEVDIAIYDEQYTPYIFNYGLIKFIPVEAVAAVVQCKSQELKPEKLKSWTKSIDRLQTSNDSIVRLATCIHIGKNSTNTIQTATKPIKVLCYIPKNETGTDDTKGRSQFNIVIEAYQNGSSKDDSPKDDSPEGNQGQDNKYEGNLKITFSEKNLLDVLQKYNQADKKGNLEKQEKNKQCNKQVDKKDNGINSILEEREIEEYKVKNEIREYTLLSFIFQFNQMLMMINNPMFFPHKAYVDMFNEGSKEE